MKADGSQIESFFILEFYKISSSANTGDSSASFVNSLDQDTLSMSVSSFISYVLPVILLEASNVKEENDFQES